MTCTPDAAIHPQNILYSPDEDFLISGGSVLDRSLFHYIDAVAKKQKIKKGVGHRVKSCETAVNGLDQCLSATFNGLNAELEPTDWGALIATACCQGRFGQPQTTDTLVLISGDKNLALAAQIRWQLAVWRVKGRTQYWHMISKPEGITAVKAIHEAGDLPFPLV
jgi:hypothetical protein